jgi:hypothetical protein
VVGGPEIERERIKHQTGCAIDKGFDDKLAASVDLILVLGGDGTRIATARLMGETEGPFWVLTLAGWATGLSFASKNCTPGSNRYWLATIARTNG